MFSREISNFPNRKVITYVLIQILTCNVSKETDPKVVNKGEKEWNIPIKYIDALIRMRGEE